MNWLKGKKTYLVSILMLFVSSINLLTGNISFNEFIFSDSMTLLLEAMGLSALRSGIKKNQEDVVLEMAKKINFPHAG